MQNLLENSSRCVSHSPSRVKAGAFKTDVKSSVTESRAQFLKVYWYCDIFPSIGFRYSGWFLESSSIIPLIPHACFFSSFFWFMKPCLSRARNWSSLKYSSASNNSGSFLQYRKWIRFCVCLVIQLQLL